MRDGTGAWERGVLACLVAATAAGCSLTSNKVTPLAGEDPKALAVSGERANWLERTGATRALEDLRKALRAGEDGTALGLLGPRTREAAREAARAAKADPESMLAGDRAPALGAAAAAMLALLRADGPATMRESDPFDPTRRAVTLRVKVGEREEATVPAVYTDGGWRIELVPGEAAPAAGGTGN
jgi:hypothetical protein